MAPTIWQYGAAQINDWRYAYQPDMKRVYDIGYRVIHLHLQDGGVVDKEYVKMLKRIGGVVNGKPIGFRVFGTFWPTRDDPREWAKFCHNEKLRLGLNGIAVNAEQQVEDIDKEMDGYWSKNFLSEFRSRMPVIALCIHTDAVSGHIHLAEWEKVGARIFIQTYLGDDLFAYSVPYIKEWVDFYGWTNLAKVKPSFAVYENSLGERNDASSCITSAKAAKTKGFIAYYMDGTFEDLSVPEQLMKGGIAY